MDYHVNLDDTNQTVFYIPYQDEAALTTPDADPHVSSFQARDLPSTYGHELRLEAYRRAWAKCLDRVQSIIRSIHAPVVEAIVQELHDSYSDDLAGLPYAEIPIISVTDPTAGSSILNEVAEALEEDEDEQGDDSTPTDTFVTHLYPGDCPNIMTAMKALITSFVERPTIQGEVKKKRRPAAALASYDIAFLEAWYDAVKVSYESPPKLVIFLHDFEKFESGIVQDMFHICSLHISTLPLIFVLSLSSPPSPSYLHLTYPRSTLALLRVRTFIVPSGHDIFEKIITKTFLDLEFQPDIMIGPVTLHFLEAYFLRHNSSLDAMITNLQLAHMKHFDDPLTVFVHDSQLGKTDLKHTVAMLLELSSSPFLDSVLSRTNRSSPATIHDVSNMLTSLDATRQRFYTSARQMRIGLKLMILIHEFMKRQERRLSYPQFTWTVSELMVFALKGKLGQPVKNLGLIVTKLSTENLTLLLEEIHELFIGIPSEGKGEDEEDATAIIKAFLDAIRSPDDTVTAEASLPEWLTMYLNGTLQSVEDVDMWDIWYTGRSPFPSELINPSLRASVLSGLLHPSDFAGGENDNSQHGNLSDQPDVSILLQRYLNSGKKINVYDWYDSFLVALENQRTEQALKKRDARKSSSPKKGKGKGRQKTKQSKNAEEEQDKQEDERDEEQWKLQVQARFIRAMHELDYLGFIKHSGRKADHVLRTVFDIVD